MKVARVIHRYEFMDKNYTRWTRKACKDNHCYQMMTLARTSLDNMSFYFIVVILLLRVDFVQGITTHVRIVYIGTPSNVTSQTNANFGFNENGTNPCAIH